ncbi:MAG: CotH kinase family protein, partial [Bacteroidales bacterium]|nr:CotH kinase family protein [Bacteroidales bacterium]
MKRNIFILFFLILFSFFSSAQKETDVRETVSLNRLREGIELSAEGSDEKNLRLNEYLASFTLDGKELIKDSKVYYFPVELDLMDTDVVKKISFETSEDDMTVKVDGTEIINGEDFTFKKVTANKVYKIQLYQGNKLLKEEKIIFTGLPIVQLYSESKVWSDKYFSRGKFRVNDAEIDSCELLYADIRYRGATTASAWKNSFAIKLKDEAGKGIDRSYFGLRNDNYWILDAMSIDDSRMRDRISTDLWNDFSSDPYYKSEEPELVNATRGRYVEVFVDDKYWGLYCMTERVDRKQLKLKKFQDETQTIRGVLYKSDSWTFETMMGYRPNIGPDPGRSPSNYNNSKPGWCSYDMKYPDVSDGQLIDWQPLWDVINFCSVSDEETFSREVRNHFDLPVWTDYYLFLELILATDNHGKNAYFYMYNIQEERKLGIAPWDLDGVLGIQWGGADISATQGFTEYIVRVEHGQNNLFRRLKENNVVGFNDTLKARYDRLRETWFSEESLLNRVDTYWELFQRSGADKREKERWGIDLNRKVNTLKEWISERVEYLNNQYGPVVDPVGVDPVAENKLCVYQSPVVENLDVRDVTPNTPV